MHKEFQHHIPLGEIFRRPTIRSLAEYIAENVTTFYAAVEPVEKKEYYELSSAQKRLYILQQMDEMSTVYNLPFAVMLEGELDLDRLGNTFLYLIKRHESLRTSFEIIGDRPVQRIHDEVEFEIGKILRPLAGRTFKNFIRPFDLSCAPLLRVGLVKLEKQKHILMVDMHHIISDGTSRRVLTEEFMALYDGKELPGLRFNIKIMPNGRTRRDKEAS